MIQWAYKQNRRKAMICKNCLKAAASLKVGNIDVCVDCEDSISKEFVCGKHSVRIEGIGAGRVLYSMKEVHQYYESIGDSIIAALESYKKESGTSPCVYPVFDAWCKSNSDVDMRKIGRIIGSVKLSTILEF